MLKLYLAFFQTTLISDYGLKNSELVEGKKLTEALKFCLSWSAAAKLIRPAENCKKAVELFLNSSRYYFNIIHRTGVHKVVDTW